MQAGGAGAQRRDGIGLREGDDEDGAVALAAREGVDEQLEADREREGLVRLLATEGDEVLGPRLPASTSPYVTLPMETSATTGLPSELGTAIASGFVPVSGSPPAGCGRRAGEVAVSAPTSPPSASRRTQ
jgi:hypothetical protein